MKKKTALFHLIVSFLMIISTVRVYASNVGKQSLLKDMLIPQERILYMLREKYLLPTSTVPSMRQEQIFISVIM